MYCTLILAGLDGFLLGHCTCIHLNNWIGWQGLLIEVVFRSLLCLVSSPDPTLEEGKGSGDFGQKAWSS